MPALRTRVDFIELDIAPTPRPSPISSFSYFSFVSVSYLFPFFFFFFSFRCARGSSGQSKDEASAYNTRSVSSRVRCGNKTGREKKKTNLEHGGADGEMSLEMGSSRVYAMRITGDDIRASWRSVCYVRRACGPLEKLRYFGLPLLIVRARLGPNGGRWSC